MLDHLENLYKGRITRLTYLKGLTATAVLLAVSIFVYLFFSDEASNKSIHALIRILCIFSSVILTMIQYGIIVKRIHDFNISGWWILVPFVNSILWLAGFFLEGTSGKNNFGEAPTNEKTLFESLFAPQPLSQTNS